MEDKHPPASKETQTGGNEPGKPINPFDKTAPPEAEQMEEDAAAEQQRKEALTERD